MTDVDEALKLENQLCFPLYACARKVTGLYTPYFKPLGITYTQYVVLLTLWEQDGRTVGELGRCLYLDSGTLTPLLKKLEERGLVTRPRSRTDERSVTISLTKEGWSMKEAAAQIPALVGSCVRLEPEEAKQLYVLLYKLLDQIGEGD